MSALFALTMLATSCSSDDDPAENRCDQYYWSHDERVLIQTLNDQSTVTYSSDNEDKIKDELAKQGLELTDIENSLWEKETEGFDTFKNCRTATIIGDNGKLSAIMPYLINWSPCYKDPAKGYILTLDYVFYVEPKTGVEIDELEKLAERYNAVFLGVHSMFDDVYLIGCTLNSKGFVLDIANRFYESGLVEWSQPSMGGNGSVDI